MKKLLSFLIAFTTFCLTGCLDTQEDITIKADGSGTYVSSVNMSGLFDMMQMAAAMDTSANSELKNFSDKNIDSIIALRTFSDTASNLTPEEKELFRDATMHFVVNQENKVFKMTFKYPFKKPEDIQKIIALQESSKGVNPLNKAKGSELEEAGMPEADIYNVVYKNGLIERTIDETKMAAFLNKEEFKNAKDMESMYSEITFSTAIHLPKAAKKYSGDKLKVSDDKKTIQLKYTMMDMLENPKSLVFKVEY